jgi:hypothetical protein
MNPVRRGRASCRRLLLVVSALGGLLFAGLVLLSFIEPLWIERAAREVLRHEVEKRVGERIDQRRNACAVQLAQKALGRTEAVSAYGKASRQLPRELRIFAGVNTPALALLG